MLQKKIYLYVKSMNCVDVNIGKRTTSPPFVTSVWQLFSHNSAPPPQKREKLESEKNERKKGGRKLGGGKSRKQRKMELREKWKENTFSHFWEQVQIISEDAFSIREIDIYGVVKKNLSIKVKMTSQRAENLVHVQQDLGKRFYKKIFS